MSTTTANKAHLPLPRGVRESVPLAPLTTLGVGGRARFFAHVRDAAQLGLLLAWARERRLPTLLLGGGSNVVVADSGFAGLALQFADSAIDEQVRDGQVIWRVGAGAHWDSVVARAVEMRLAGLECLSGIPGNVGAAPLQNIGAYGQELAECVRAVHVVERASGENKVLSADACGFGYRWSRFKGEWRERYVVTAVELALRAQGRPTVRYPQLQNALVTNEPTLAEVRRTVMSIRRRKSMLCAPDDPNRRSVGSFFVNPIVDAVTLERVRASLDAERARAMPCFPQAQGRFKLSAAWLIEAAGFAKGHQDGRVGLSTRHCLALVNRGGASASDIVRLASKVRERVWAQFGVALQPEPQLIGFSACEVGALTGAA